MNVFDIHMHVIPGVDDGSHSIEESIALIKKSIDQGVTDIIATPHSSAYDFHDDFVDLQYKLLCNEVKRQKLNIKLHLGCEILYYDTEEILFKLNEGIYRTLDGTKYVLVEFDPYYQTNDEVISFVDRLLDNGYIPVIAHAERYRFTSVELIRELKKMGALIQINAYSLKKEINKATRLLARQLVDERLVDCIGSDAHRLNHRPPDIASGIEFLYNNYDKEYVDMITYGNARKLFGGDR